MRNFTVYRDEDLERFLLKSGPKKTRALTADLDEFLAAENTGCAFFLPGVPESGKTSIMLEAISRLPAGECLYMTIDSPCATQTASDFLSGCLSDRRIKYIFIDDADRLADFGCNSGFISNDVAPSKKLVVAGEPTAIKVAWIYPFEEKGTLHYVKYPTFREWSEITGSMDLRQYLEGNMGKDTPRIKDIGAYMAGILSSLERVYENCNSTLWSIINWMIRTGRFRQGVWLTLNSLALRFLDGVLADLWKNGAGIPKTFLNAAREIKSGIKRKIASTGLLLYEVEACVAFLSDIGLVSKIPLKFAWEQYPPCAPDSVPVDEDEEETFRGPETPFDIADICLNGQRFRMPGMIHSLCASMAARMGQKLPESIKDTIFAHAAWQALVMDIYNLIPDARARKFFCKKYYCGVAYRGQKSRGPGDGMFISDTDRHGNLVDILISTEAGPWLLEITEMGDRKRIVPIADFLWELPDFMEMITHEEEKGSS